MSDVKNPVQPPEIVIDEVGTHGVDVNVDVQTSHHASKSADVTSEQNDTNGAHSSTSVVETLTVPPPHDVSKQTKYVAGKGNGKRGNGNNGNGKNGNGSAHQENAADKPGPQETSTSTRSKVRHPSKDEELSHLNEDVSKQIRKMLCVINVHALF